MATSYYPSFINKLEEIFMMDHAELDFGIYRIMNQKRAEIKQFLEHDLLPQVRTILSANSGTETAAIKARMQEIERQAASFGASAENNPEYQQLKEKLQQSADVSQLENEVYNHLTIFFGRYYDEGDFVSKRRYKDNAYAIPYNGEEVKLHWANADQYYIKTSEYFQNYSFRIGGKLVHFVLKDASTEMNNNKSQNNMERRFALYQEEGCPTIEEVDGELNIYFTYQLMAKAIKQKDLCASAIETLSSILPESWKLLLENYSATDNRCVLEKHLVDYTAKNSFDYFIHKDLGGFLRRELDFYIKNEVMHLDDLDSSHIQSQLAQVKAIKGVGDKIITFLASLEDFQKKLWLKKKFVLQTDYCITLDRIPEKFYDEICANDAQREEWVRLFAIDEIEGLMGIGGYSEPLSIDFLKQNPYLVLDTAFFSDSFKHKLIASIENVDKDCNGLLINSENFQALNLLQEKYCGSIKCTYIDPPYNAKSSEILYKNTFKHSSWLSLMENRLLIGRNLLKRNGIFEVAIDDVENARLISLCDSIYSDYSGKADLSILINPSGQQGKNFSTTGEYVHCYFQDEPNMVAKELRDEESADVRGFMNGAKGEGGNYLRTSGKTCFYPIYVRENQVIGIGDVCDDEFHPSSANVQEAMGVVAIYPIDGDGVERKWLFGHDTVGDILSELSVKTNRNTGLLEIIRTKNAINYKTIWTDSCYSAKEYGTNLLTKMFNKPVFSFPKSIHAVRDCVGLAVREHPDEIILDYFGGSGTTAHAVIELNRADQGNRKYIICEMGSYFSTATRPRIEKATYSFDWREGKPVSRDGISHCFKYIRLEQYEDTLNNLVPIDVTFDFSTNGSFKESYMLGYMMDTETKGSLFNLEWFVNPFAMTLKTTKDNELVETKVDMVETFNFLIGLNVETMHWHEDDNICVVEGVTHKEEDKTLVIWRNCEKIDNEALNRFFEKMDYSTLAHDFDLIYVNGDNTLPNLRRDDERWKVVLIEQEFQKRMFEEE